MSRLVDLDGRPADKQGEALGDRVTASKAWVVCERLIVEPEEWSVIRWANEDLTQRTDRLIAIGHRV